MFLVLRVKKIYSWAVATRATAMFSDFKGLTCAASHLHSPEHGYYMHEFLTQHVVQNHTCFFFCSNILWLHRDF